MTRLSKQIKRKNEALQSLIFDMLEASREHDAPVWRTIAETLSSPTRDQPRVNLYELNGYDDEEILLVPGKVLGTGVLRDEDLTVAAHKFSDSAREAINASGQAITLRSLLNDNEDGTNIRIIS